MRLKESLSAFLNAALAASKEAMENITQQDARTLVASVRMDIDGRLPELIAPIRDACRNGLLNVLAPCFTLLAAALALWTTLR